MAQVIIFTNEKGGVSVCIPSGELPINEVLAKDCPAEAIIVEDSELPANKTYFDAWELIDGKIIVNEIKKASIDAKANAKNSALEKLNALGLTVDDLSALGIK